MYDITKWPPSPVITDTLNQRRERLALHIENPDCDLELRDGSEDDPYLVFPEWDRAIIADALRRAVG